MIESINKIIADVILLITRETTTFWENVQLLNFSFHQIVIDIFLVSILFYFLFLLLKGSRAFHILIGLTFLAVLFVLSKGLQLMTLGWLLDRFLTIILVAIPVIFQQELRMGLERLGSTKLFASGAVQKTESITRAIIEACQVMLSKKTGALIVLQKDTSLAEYAETGVILNANVSKELLLNIFQPRSPLHDGAVIVKEDRVKAASCILPTSFKNFGHDFGTRHKAAIGLSELTDAQVIILSEEKGTVSYAKDGKIYRDITIEKLNDYLKQFYKPKKKK